MAVPYSVETCRQLERAFQDAGVLRPLRLGRYEPGSELSYDVTGVVPASRATVRLSVERFVGGGFAGQVYRVKVLAVEGQPIAGLSVAGGYAMKILIPPSAAAVRFRNLIYALGYQGPFALQVNPDAARAGALWQKFIRRAASIEFGSESAVVDILATFVDARLGSCGELSEWIDGRNWRFEVDDNLPARRRWKVTDPLEAEGVGSPEYRAKKAFMARLVDLFHRLGASELARQYEWWTCKSQPNVLKRRDSDDRPDEGLTAVDFRAGLALLACLPMSPGDFKLIGQGLLHRGNLVQFDLGDIDRLQTYVRLHRDHFQDMAGALEELRRTEEAYRQGQIDLTHHHVRLLRDRDLRSQILDAAVRNWQVANVVDPPAADLLRASRVKTVLFALLGVLCGLGAAALVVGGIFALIFGAAAVYEPWRAACLPRAWTGLWVALAGLVLKLAAGAGRALWGRADLRRHWRSLLTSLDYLGRAMRARRAEQLIRWHHAARVSEARAAALLGSPVRFAGHLVLSLLPAGLHRTLTDWPYAWGRFRALVTHPIRLYFDADARQQWMRDMVEDGLAHGMLTEQDAQTIRAQLAEPFIQKYLQCLAVHMCTIVMTEVGCLIIVGILLLTHREWSFQTAWAVAVGVVVLFQITPISPGSLTRGLYALYVVIRERNYRDYKLALWISFWKYIGYLGFPIQMAYRYPAIARFMAGQWATQAVHHLPVFGERGALAEHAVFDLFYNRPLSIRRRMLRRAEARAGRPARHYHVPIVAAAAWLAWTWLLPAGAGGWQAILAGITAGAAGSMLAGGASTARRIVLGGLAALLAGLARIAVDLAVHAGSGSTLGWTSVLVADLLPAFGGTLLGVLAAALSELAGPEPARAAGSASGRPLTSGQIHSTMVHD